MRRTARLVTERADYVFVVKGNAPETLGILDTIDWERDAAGSFAEDLDKVHGRLERRSTRVLTPPKGLVNYPGVRQVARVTRYREPLKKGPDDVGRGGRASWVAGRLRPPTMRPLTPGSRSQGARKPARAPAKTAQTTLYPAVTSPEKLTQEPE